MLENHRPALVHIATHPDSHAEYCKLAAAYGVRVVVCEKPLADTLRAARDIAALHTSGKIRIIANHERRYQADYIQAKALLDEGRLGPLRSVKAALYMGKTRRLLDVLWHDGTHLADAMMFLTNRVMRGREVWGTRLSAREGTAFLAGVLEQAGPRRASRKGGGIPFVIELGAGRDHLVFEMEFSMEQGRLRIGNGVFEVWESGPSPYAEQFRSLKKTVPGFAGLTGYFTNMIADAAACVRDSAHTPRSSALDGLRVIEYLNAIKPWRT
jgi:predicted dehydrogenase